MNTLGLAYQMPLFKPTAENFACLRILTAPPGAVRRSRREHRARFLAAEDAKRIEPSLADLSQEEIAAAPRMFQELCRLTTVKEAVTLCEEFGGLQVFLPLPEDGTRWKKGALRDKFKALLSPESYTRLLRGMVGAGQVTFPNLELLKRRRRYKQIRQMIDALIARKEPHHKAVQAIARQERLHMSTIYKILKQPD